MPFLTVATSELVVPRSMPTASRCWCGAVDSPGSDICSSAISIFLERLDRVADFLLELLDEHQLARRLGRRLVGARAEQLLEMLVARALLFGQLAQQLIECL